MCYALKLIRLNVQVQRQQFWEHWAYQLSLILNIFLKYICEFNNWWGEKKCVLCVSGIGKDSLI